MPGGWRQKGFLVDMEQQSQAAWGSSCPCILQARACPLSSSGSHPAPDAHACRWTGTIWRQPGAQLGRTQGEQLPSLKVWALVVTLIPKSLSLLAMSKSSSCSDRWLVQVSDAGFFDPFPRPINSLPPSSGLTPRTFIYEFRAKTSLRDFSQVCMEHRRLSVFASTSHIQTHLHLQRGPQL